MSRRAYLYFILTFLLGLIVGGAATIFFGWRSGFIRHRHPDEKHIVQFLKRDLNLSDSQTQQLEQIVHETGEKFRQLQEQNQPQFDAIRMESRDRIRKILNPDQLAKFNQLVERIDRHRKGHRRPQ
jgi:Spy/CpxP family protein refolding chaperone